MFYEGAVELDSNGYTANQSLILEVPSAIVPGESVLLIHATHPGASRPRAGTTRRFEESGWFAGPSRLHVARHTCHSAHGPMRRAGVSS